MKTKNNKLTTGETHIPDMVFMSLCVIAVLFAAWTFTGSWPGTKSPYNSYVLQAQSWLSGKLDLPENYQHLEIAIFNGKYYISFPPFPSYILLPFVALGIERCDTYISLISAVFAAIFAFKILMHFGISKERSVFFSLFLTIASNWLFTSQNAWVWFIAQNLAFTLSLMAIYYALKGKAGISLFAWGCAVGCRPLQALYLPVLLFVIYQSFKKSNPSDTIMNMISKKWLCAIPVFLIALSYMLLNFARFGNPLEFGHNYLPEFTEAENGQFHISYMKNNLLSLFKMPKISYEAAWEYPKFNGMNIFFISPIFISFIAYTVYSFLKKDKNTKVLLVLILVMSVAELLAITAHKTMGGWHFGNRYPNDILPLIFLGLAASLPQNTKYDKLNYPLFIFGLCINLVGAVTLYMG